jgi:hypothetical protein
MTPGRWWVNESIEWARGSMLPVDPPLAHAADLAIPLCVGSG